MEAAAYQSQARDAAQLIHAEAMVRIMEAVAKPGCDPELAIKAINATTAIAQAVPKDKDPLANLPTFNITFVNGRMTGEAVPAPLGIVEQLDQPLLAFLPTEAMRAQAHINLEIEEELWP